MASFLDVSILVVSLTLRLMVGNSNLEYDVTLKVLHRHMFALGKRIDPLPTLLETPQQNWKSMPVSFIVFNVRLAFARQVLWDFSRWQAPPLGCCHMRLNASEGWKWSTATVDGSWGLASPQKVKSKVEMELTAELTVSLNSKWPLKSEKKQSKVNLEAGAGVKEK